VDILESMGPSELMPTASYGTTPRRRRLFPEPYDGKVSAVRDAPHEGDRLCLDAAIRRAPAERAGSTVRQTPRGLPAARRPGSAPVR
ncbi:hypothetical protein, partial [Escherichia coli]|uniref:hypothetical protein n=1 Tax=Escherichia coli TaxID=562 RepID=UPI0013D614E3